MFIGQLQARSHIGNMGISAARTHSHPAAKRTSLSRYDRVEIGTHSQTKTQSGIYQPDSSQMRMMESTPYTRVAPDSRLQKTLLPPSEQSSYTEEDALLHQYRKQFRIEGHFEGDTFIRTSSEPVKLILADDITKEELQKFNSELAEKGLGTEIDWRGVENDLVQIGINFDNIERFSQKTDYLASRYAVLKDRIQNQFTGDKQETELQKLENIYTKAKEEIANSHAAGIGEFYENFGQSGVAADMRSSVLSLIDQKADAYTDYIKKTGIAVNITDSDKQWLKQDDAWLAAQLRQQVSASSEKLQKFSVNEQAPYNETDLSFAGAYAKTLSQQLKNPTWNVNKSDTALGQHLASQYNALQNSAAQAGVSEKMSHMLTSAFRPFMDQLMNTLDTSIDENRKWAAEKPWMSGMMRTDHIDRENVYHAFQNAVIL